MKRTILYVFVGLVVFALLVAWYFLYFQDKEIDRNVQLDHDQNALNGRIGRPYSPIESVATSPGVDETSDLDNRPSAAIHLVEWDNELPPYTFLGALEEQALIDESGVNQFIHSWLDTCLQVAVFSVHVEMHENLGQRAGQAKQLSVICDEVLPESFNVGGDGEDLGAVHAEMEESYRKGSYLQVARRLRASLREDGETEFLRKTADRLASGMDTGTIQAAINALLSHGFSGNLLLLELRDIAHFPNFQQISHDVATVLLCERIGGCKGSGHPLVLQRCFKGAMGCNQPAGIHDAIYQLTPPVDYEVFWVLLSETRRFMRQHRR